MPLDQSGRDAVERQRLLSHLVGGILVWPLVVLWMRWVRGYTIDDLVAVRATARRLLSQADGPVLVCANHLTWIDSLALQWALTSPSEALRDPRLFAWNLPEWRNFYSSRWLRVGCYFSKCIPIVRGGDRDQQGVVLAKVRYVLERGDLVTMFPEGGRSRSGRVDLDELTYGAGRIVCAVGDCRVLCVYLRGREQHASTVLPVRGERFVVQMELIDACSDARGLRASREAALRIGRKLVELEERHLARR